MSDTHFFTLAVHLIKRFNPRPRVQATFHFNQPFLVLFTFQSTPTRTSDNQYRIRGNFSTSCFNPRPHVQATYAQLLLKSTVRGFNPRPHVQATGSWKRMYAAEAVSIHAHTYKRPIWLKRIANSFRVSIHAHTYKRHSSADDRHYAVHSFNPRPHVQATSLKTKNGGVPNVSIHAHTYKRRREMGGADAV